MLAKDVRTIIESVVVLPTEQFLAENFGTRYTGQSVSSAHQTVFARAYDELKVTRPSPSEMPLEAAMYRPLVRLKSLSCYILM
jgi:hypothetical protein